MKKLIIGLVSVSAIFALALFMVTDARADITGISITPSSGSASYAQGASLTSSDTTLSSDHDDAGLVTTISLTDADNASVNFDSVFSSFKLSTNGDGPYDLVSLEPGHSTLLYGPDGGYSVTSGVDQTTTLTGSISDTAPVGTYTITTQILKGDVVEASATYELAVTAAPGAVLGDVTYGTLQEAVAAASDGDAISLSGDLTLTSQVTVDKPLTINGNGHTIFAPFAKTDNSNNSAIGIVGAEGDVTIENLTIDGTGSTGSRHGINIYDSNSIILDGVTVKNNNASGITISGSSVVATNLNTSGNAWGSVNVDPGSGVTKPTVFTLNSGTLGESTQIWSDGANVRETATVTVNADGYDLYRKAGTDAFFIWANKQLANVATITGESSSVIYSTIQDAVDASADGDTINVGAGAFNGFTIDGKDNLHIVGAGKSDTSIVPTVLISTGVTHKYTSDMMASVFVGHSSNVTIEDMTISSNSVTPGAGGADAIVFWDASSGTIKDCSITGTYSINGAQTGQGIAIDADGSENASLTVDGCTISGFQKNAIDAINGNGATSGATGTITVSVIGSVLTGAGPTTAIAQNGLVVWNRGGGAVTASISNSTVSGFSYTPDPQATGMLAYGGGEITTVRNSIFSNNDFHLSTTEGSPAIDAIDNYWGSASGPDEGNLDGDISFIPWFMDSGMTALSSEASQPNTDGNATVSVASPKVVVTSNSQPVTVEVGNTQNAALVLGALLTSGSGAIPQMTINSDRVKVEIPASNISGNSSWNGVLTLPTLTTAPVITPTSGNQINVATSIEVGSSDTELTFDQPVKLTFPGHASHLVGWSRNGVFTEITNTCDSSTSPTLNAGADCKTVIGADMVVWTKHFSTFVTYTEVPAVSTSRAGRSGSSSRAVGVASPVGQVLGAFSDAERLAQIEALKAQVLPLMQRLLSLLQAQYALALKAGN